LSDQTETITESINAELRIGDENIRFSADITNQPIHVYDLLPLFQNVASKVVEISVREIEAQGKSISCKKGCDACCYQLVPISRAEGFILLSLINTLPKDQQDRIRVRFEHSIKALERAGILEKMDQVINGDDRMQLREIGIIYFNLKLPCPFLEDHCCTIHQYRPLSCREFLVVSDPVHCSKPSLETVENVVLPKRVSPIVHQMSCHPDEGGRGYFPFIQLLDRAEALQSDHSCEPAVDLVKQFFLALGKP
jgi:Fe-S-cluster containining protein